LGGLSGNSARIGGALTNAGIPVTFEVGENNQSTEFGGTITDGSGTVAVTKIGTGTLTLTGASTYTGGTTISSGALQIGNGTTDGSLVGDIADNSSLVFANTGNLTFSGAVSGTGGLTMIGAGALTLTGENTYSGATTLASGAIVLANATAINTILTPSLSAGVNNTGGFLVFNYTGGSDPAATVLAALTAAYNGGVNSFQSGQIRDTSATTLIGLGWVDRTGTSEVIVMPALYGDANLDGVAGFSDLGILLANYGQSGKTWSQGDFNYDGTAGFSDLGLLLANYGQTGPLNINDMP
jgi:autotransporter-associated beta strand protein